MPNGIYTNDPGIASRLRQAREAAGFTSAKDGARALNEPDSTYTQHENAKRGFGIGKAKRYAMFFRVNLDWLMTGQGPQKGPTSIEERHRIGPRKPVHLFLKLHRKHKGLTQQQVADRFETRDGEPVSKGTISRWENNERIIGTDELAAYAEAIGVPILALYRSPSDQPSFDEIAAHLPRELRQKAFEIITWFAS